MRPAPPFREAPPSPPELGVPPEPIALDCLRMFLIAATCQMHCYIERKWFMRNQSDSNLVFNKGELKCLQIKFTYSGYLGKLFSFLLHFLVVALYSFLNNNEGDKAYKCLLSAVESDAPHRGCGRPSIQTAQSLGWHPSRVTHQQSSPSLGVGLPNRLVCWREHPREGKSRM